MKIKSLGPGLLFAGAAIGVSHLVQSTRAGADFGFSLLWALIIVNIVKYPFFQYGARYANATGENLLSGYNKLHKGAIITYAFVNFCSMFTIQAAITLVTTGLAMNIFGFTGNPILVASIVMIVSALILLLGKYTLLDKMMKIIIIVLTFTTLLAVSIALNKNEQPVSFVQQYVFENSEFAFLIAFLGWMPAPLDVSIWQSLWSEAKQKESPENRTLKTTLFDFNVGYVATLILGICFLAMGALVMYNSGENFKTGALGFSKQLIEMYTKNIGQSGFILIAIAAFTTMFSTNISALDASPRGMQKAINLLSNKTTKHAYTYWILFLSIGTIVIISFFTNQMLMLIKIATIASFLTAPFFAILNYKLITSNHTPKEYQPKLFLKILSWIGIVFLICFSIWYLTTLF